MKRWSQRVAAIGRVTGVSEKGELITVAIETPSGKSHAFFDRAVFADMWRHSRGELVGRRVVVTGTAPQQSFRFLKDDETVPGQPA